MTDLDEKADDLRAEEQLPGLGLRLVTSILALGSFALVLFWPAGRLDWVLGWAYLGLFAVSLFVGYQYLKRVNPAVIVARMRKPGPGTPTWDKVWLGVFAILFLGIYVVAGLDARYGWSSVPLWCWGLGLALFVPGYAAVVWAMGANPFFEKTVRIQKDRGHRVIDTGPYAIVRHPGYASFVPLFGSTPLLLGSWWAFAPLAACLISVVVRTALEDRTLQRGLPGYADYAKRVRYRLLPGIW
jgi:protein-S-isoprenylcysteine O-methyltransferase Ste14